MDRRTEKRQREKLDLHIKDIKHDIELLCKIAEVGIEELKSGIYFTEDDRGEYIQVAEISVSFRIPRKPIKPIKLED
jgi:hypothetical protein